MEYSQSSSKREVYRKKKAILSKKISDNFAPQELEKNKQSPKLTEGRK